MRQYLDGLFAEYKIHLNIIMAAIVISGDLAYDYGWHELTLTPRGGGEPQVLRKRYLELWSKQPASGWRIIRYIESAGR